MSTICSNQLLVQTSGSTYKATPHPAPHPLSFQVILNKHHNFTLHTEPSNPPKKFTKRKGGNTSFFFFFLLSPTQMLPSNWFENEQQKKQKKDNEGQPVQKGQVDRKMPPPSNMLQNVIWVTPTIASVLTDH